MKTPEDEAFDELATRQGDWGSGFQVKKAMAADKLQEPVREALKLALVALEESQTDNDTMEFWDRKSKAITAITAALAQPVQEPVGEIRASSYGNYPVVAWVNGYVAKIGDKFYTTPPQREWVGLTDKDLYVVMEEESCSYIAGAKWAEEILRGKNT